MTPRNLAWLVYVSGCVFSASRKMGIDSISLHIAGFLCMALAKTWFFLGSNFMRRLSPVVELNYFLLFNVVYLNYVSMRNCDSSVVCIYCCVAVRVNGSGDVPGVVVPNSGS